MHFCPKSDAFLRLIGYSDAFCDSTQHNYYFERSDPHIREYSPFGGIGLARGLPLQPQVGKEPAKAGRRTNQGGGKVQPLREGSTTSAGRKYNLHDLAPSAAVISDACRN